MNKEQFYQISMYRNGRKFMYMRRVPTSCLDDHLDRARTCNPDAFFGADKHI